MTCRDKLTIEHPSMVDDKWPGGCKACPHTYGYLDAPKNCAYISCRDCWDREIPETKPSDALKQVGEMAENMSKEFEAVKKAADKFLYSDDVIGKVVETREENGGISFTAEPVIKHIGPISGEFITGIKDSGDRTQFETGAVRDMREGKGRCDLMPLEVVAALLNKIRDGLGVVLHNVATFQKTQDTYYLYNAIERFYERNGDKQVCTMLLEVAKHYEEGAKKYGPDNWRRGIPTWCYIDSAIRHYLKWLRGDTDEHHDRAFVWNLMCCIWEVDYRNGEASDK